MPRRHDEDAGGPAALLAAKAALRDQVWSAMSVKGIARFPAPVDLVVTGCVAVGTDGARLGKGGGFSDLEFALAAAAG